MDSHERVAGSISSEAASGPLRRGSFRQTLRSSQQRAFCEIPRAFVFWLMHPWRMVYSLFWGCELVQEGLFELSSSRRAEFFLRPTEQANVTLAERRDETSPHPQYQPVYCITTYPPLSVFKMKDVPPGAFAFPYYYSFPPFFSLQPNASTRAVQFQRWSRLIQSWCRQHNTYKLNLAEAVESELFRNTQISKRLSLSDARTVLDWMCKGDEEGGGGRRAEWVDGPSKTTAWIWWKRPEEWAGIIADWVGGFTILSIYLG